MAEEEEEDTKGRKWRVTYTKHVKQKRKVYHDGFLELTVSGDKVRLYDESENLIESKFLKKAESIECGKSFTMDCHLVDIADPVHLLSNPTVTSIGQQNGNKRTSFNRKPLHKVSNLMQSNVKVTEKKAEPLTSGVPSSNLTVPHSLCKEWSVLYTTQLTQKAKKYHDGTLRLSEIGSHARQVRLYDEHERLLESKVLGKEDMLESGRTLIMQAHLVDINLSTVQVTKENISVSSVRKPFQKPTCTIGSFAKEDITVPSFRKPFQKPTSSVGSFVDTRKEAASVEPSTLETNFLKEWNVLYTTQLNKKAKTYHDGSLRLAQAKGSLTKQITLASEDGQILGSRHLKSFECIESGAECELSGYLVQIDGLRVCQEGYTGSNHKSPLKQFVKSNTLMKSIPTMAVEGTNEEQVKSMKPQTGYRMQIEKTTHSSNQTSPLKQSVKSKTLVQSVPTKEVVYRTKEEQVRCTKPPTGNRMEMEKTTNSKTFFSVNQRDACQIMSVLRKPTAGQEGEETLSVKKAHLLSHLIQIDTSTSQHMLPEAQRMHEIYGNAYHQVAGKESSEVQFMTKENCSGSSMQNSTSVLSGTTSSALHVDRCESVILEPEKADKHTSSVEESFTDIDNFDFPTFDLGF